MLPNFSERRHGQPIKDAARGMRHGLRQRIRVCRNAFERVHRKKRFEQKQGSLSCGTSAHTTEQLLQRRNSTDRFCRPCAAVQRFEVRNIGYSALRPAENRQIDITLPKEVFAKTVIRIRAFTCNLTSPTLGEVFVKPLFSHMFSSTA